LASHALLDLITISYDFAVVVFSVLRVELPELVVRNCVTIVDISFELFPRFEEGLHLSAFAIHLNWVEVHEVVVEIDCGLAHLLPLHLSILDIGRVWLALDSDIPVDIALQLSLCLFEQAWKVAL